MRKYIKSMLMAINMFTIIPLPHYEWDDDGVRHMMKMYTLIGGIVGLIWYFGYKGLVLLGISKVLIAAITMIIPFIITGMLHLDGYMDVCDAILSRRDQKEKIRILKDPNTGAFSVISLAILFIVDFAAIYTIVDSNKNPVVLILIPIISRGLMALMLLTKETMKESSLGSYFKKGTGKVDKIVILIFIIISVILLIKSTGVTGLILSIGMIGISTIAVNYSIKQLGGMSGDIAGYGLIIAEVTGIILYSFMI